MNTFRPRISLYSCRHSTTINEEIWGKSNVCILFRFLNRFNKNFSRIPYADISFGSRDCVKTEQSCCCDFFSKEVSILRRGDRKEFCLLLIPPPATGHPYLYCLIVRASRGSTGNPGRERHRYPSKASWRNRCCSRTSVVLGSLAIFAEMNSLSDQRLIFSQSKGCSRWNVRFLRLERNTIHFRRRAKKISVQCSE